MLYLSLKADSITREHIIMGTISTITVDETKIQNGFNLLKKIEKSISSYDKNAKVYKLNLGETLIADRYLLEVLKKSQEFYQLTDGYFDITIGSITKNLYKFGEDEQIPTKRELENAKINIEGILQEKNSIRLDEGIKLDLGGIGKGYAIDKVAQYYQEQNITKGKIALSGDIRCINPCEFQIQSPFEEDKTLMSFHSKIPNLSISTSGTYRRFIKNKKHHHLINPKTKRQSNSFVSITIFTKKDNTKADAIATALSVMPKEKVLDFLKREDLGAILVNEDGAIVSSNLEIFLN